jgi:hypothetical protein
MPTTTPSVADKSGFCRKIHISVLAEQTFTQRWVGLNGTFCSVPGSGVDTLQWFSGLAAWWKRPAIQPMQRAFSETLLSLPFLSVFSSRCIFFFMSALSCNFFATYSLPETWNHCFWRGKLSPPTGKEGRIYSPIECADGQMAAGLRTEQWFDFVFLQCASWLRVMLRRLFIFHRGAGESCRM